MKQPKNKFKSFDQFGVEEKMGVPSGIVEIADKTGEYLMEILWDKGILDNQEFHKTYKCENPHPEFPVDAISLSVTHQLKPFMSKPISAEGSFDGTSLKIVDSKLLFEITVNTSISLMESVSTPPRELFSKVLEEIKGLFYHEFLHVYEEYKRTQKDKLNNMLRTKDFLYSSGASTINANNADNSEIPPEVSKFIFMIYASASFEVRARVSQVYPFIKDIANPHEREKVIKQTFQWQIAEALAKFNGEEYYKLLVKLGGSEDSVKRLVSNVSVVLLGLSKHQSAFLIKSVEGENVPSDDQERAVKRVESNLKNVTKETSRDPLQFFKHWQKKFNMEGNKALHKLGKLTTI